MLYTALFTFIVSTYIYPIMQKYTVGVFTLHVHAVAFLVIWGFLL